MTATPPLCLGVARRGHAEALLLRWGLIEREHGVTPELATAARAYVRVRALGLPDQCPAYVRAVRADAPLLAFFHAVDDWARLRFEMQRRPLAAVLRWRAVGAQLLSLPSC